MLLIPSKFWLGAGVSVVPGVVWSAPSRAGRLDSGTLSSGWASFTSFCGRFAPFCGATRFCDRIAGTR